MSAWLPSIALISISVGIATDRVCRTEGRGRCVASPLSVGSVL